jgi:hypothetical protein
MKELEKLEPGLVMDSFVAEHILGWTKVIGQGPDTLYISPNLEFTFASRGELNLLSFSEYDSDGNPQEFLSPVTTAEDGSMSFVVGRRVRANVIATR